MISRKMVGWTYLCVLIAGLFLLMQPAMAQTAPFADGEFVRVADQSLAGSIEFSKNYKADFNNDGVVDSVVCSNKNYSVKVFDGKNPSTVLYNWDGPTVNTIVTDPDKPKVISKRSYTGCSTTELVPGRPSIVISNSYIHPVLGYRIGSEQYVLQNLGMTSNGTIQMEARIIKMPDGVNYRAAVRSVKCAPYPREMVEKGKTPGSLCFFAGYDQGFVGGYGNKVALLKLEDQNAKLVAKDLTGSSGLPWKGGVSGTLMSVFRTYKNSSGSIKSDGLSMMGGAWLDYNKDGLPDLITVGQHASIWAFKMVLNTSKLEGISFTKTDVMTASNVSMTEFLTVSNVNEQDSKITLPCVYLTGEVEKLSYLRSYDVPDHIRCYENNAWVVHKLPGANPYSSVKAGASIKVDTEGRILALAPNFYRDSAGNPIPAVPATNLFEINTNDTCQVKLDSALMQSDRTTVIKTASQTVTVAKGTSPRIGGWVDCNSTKHNAYFSGITFVSGTSNITQLGWWTEANFLAHQTIFEAIKWKAVKSFVAAPNVTKSVKLWNGCSKNASTITATVLSCTENVSK